VSDVDVMAVSGRWGVGSSDMAEELQVGGTHVKIRNPFGVFVLALVTLGIYYFVWYYKVNRELRDASGIDVSPVVALLAITIGWVVIVPPFVSWYRTFQRIQQAQQQARVTSEVSPILGFILYVIALYFLPVELLYAQDELNKLWRARSTSSV
jgi:Na+-driven multidrug efflux pump